jgi:hypothetical protein
MQRRQGDLDALFCGCAAVVVGCMGNVNTAKGKFHRRVSVTKWEV